MLLPQMDSFVGAAQHLDDLDLPRMGALLGVGEDEIHAVIDVEAAGYGFDTYGRPKMLFEPHRFFRNLSGAERDEAVRQGLAYRNWGEKPYPSDSYPTLIRAMKINANAALLSASWGLGQILGENHELAGFSSVESMVVEFKNNEDVHLEAMLNFILATRLDHHLRNHDWKAFARGYNGKLYAKHNYHGRLKAAYEKWSRIKDTVWKGDKIVLQDNDMAKTIQVLLDLRGYPEVGKPDGIIGSKTRGAIMAFQADNALPVTGRPTLGLIVALKQSRKRDVAAPRAKPVPSALDDLPVTKPLKILKRIGYGLFTTSGLSAVWEGSGDIDDLISGVGKFNILWNSLLNLSPQLIVALAGMLIVVIAYQIIRAQFDAYREGRL